MLAARTRVGSRTAARRALPALSARADVHCATYRHAIESVFFFADSQGHVRTGQRAARAAGRGGWVCEGLLETPIFGVLEPKTPIFGVLDLN